MAETIRVNPWRWQDHYGFSQAIEVRGGQRLLYCAGQTSVDGEGNPLHPGNMEAQIGMALDNLETVLRQAGMSLRNVVRLNYYTTDIPAFFAAATAFGPRLQAAGIQPAGTLLGVASLFHPDALVEIEATAVE
jgi:enamine deaminase RidA (YjgF/YER057c/UK114 family)